jgi:hypothetical protein
MLADVGGRLGQSRVGGGTEVVNLIRELPKVVEELVIGHEEALS